ncbi:MAG TPA: fibronectin type III domain-containing protein [Fervidobacterium sp.]|nr:fibronectin type III domain-containing protein [Fervidobacterium sp.]HOL03766.1 fibronectin type III domain-containing protein [Fervidobacterium sp.]HPP18312.1 fibronectin type III domain-containing protein [Fervidobacterium sp.]
MKKLMLITVLIFLALLVACGRVKFNPPQTPTDLNATALSSTQIKLTWQDKSTDELGFKIERKTGASGTWKETAEASANTETFTDTNLDSNTTYYYRIKAYNNFGYSGYSNEASATTSIGIPQAPTDLNATALSSTEIKLTWQDKSTDELGFKIERRTGASGTWEETAEASANTELLQIPTWIQILRTTTESKLTMLQAILVIPTRHRQRHRLVFHKHQLT